MDLLRRCRRVGLAASQLLWLFAGGAVVTGAVVTTVVIIKNNASKAVNQAKNGFTGGLFTSLTPAGTIEWQLLFTKKPGASVYKVSGQFGDGMACSNVTGQYDPDSDRLNAGTFTPNSESLGLGTPIPLIAVGGHYDRGTDSFSVEPEGLAHAILPRDVNSPKPGEPMLEATVDIPSPQNAGELLQGTVHVRVRNVTDPTELRFSVDMDGGRGVRYISIDEDDSYDIDLKDLDPMTVPYGIASGEVPVEFQLDLTHASGNGVHISKTVKILGALGNVRPVQVRVACDQNISATSPFEATLYLTYRLQSDSDTDVRIIQKATIEPLGDPSAALALPDHEFIGHAAKTPLPAIDPGMNWKFTLEKEGTYRIRFEIGGDSVAVFHGEAILDISANSTPVKPGDPPAPKPKTKLQGGITVDPAKTKVNVPVKMSVNVLNADSDDELDVTATIKLLDDKGRVVSQRTKPYKLIKGKQRTGDHNVTVSKPGDYTLVLEITGDKIETLHGEAKFTVEDDASASPSDTGAPSPSPSLGATGDSGNFGLVAKVVGHVPGPQADPYGTWSGSIGESNISATFASTRADYDSHASLQATWSVPPPSIKAGEIIDLIVTASGSVSGKDHASPSIDAVWSSSGGEFVESKSAFAGVSQSGAIIGSGSGHYKFKAPQSGEFTLYSAQSGLAWGSGGAWHPCEYKYKMGSAPISGPAPTASPMPTPSPSATPGSGPDWGDGGMASGSIVPLTPDDPDDTAHIQAFIDPADLTVFAGETSKIVNVHISGYRHNTLDRVEVIFPQKTDNWASLPGQIVVGAGNGSYDPSNMGMPEHVDGYFFSARTTAPGGTFTIWIVVQQKGAGSVRIPLTVHVFGRPRPLGSVPAVSSPPPNPTASPTPPPVGHGGYFKPPVIGAISSFDGTWKTDMGLMVLTADVEGNVSGTFGEQGGTLSGKANGRKLTFSFKQGSSSGTGEMTISLDGNSVAGNYEIPDPQGATTMDFAGTRSK